ncbi:MAG TPA: hypothetical protein DDZ91_10000 [Firmicutes bacterium]|nr:hypothetical protein [Bacillota bacterium]
MNLAQRIIDMSEICDQEAIVKSLQIPEEIVRGVIDGTIDNESLNGFDPSRPYEIKLVKENGLKVIEQKLDQIVSVKDKALKKRIFSKAWGVFLDGVWILALVVCVSCAIYGFYSVGQVNGFENEILTKSALFIKGVFCKLTSIL